MAEDDHSNPLLRLKVIETGHPFGFEDEVSVLTLLRFFSNNLYLGQWEFVKACIDQLHAKASFLKVDVQCILRNIATNPYNYCLGPETIPSPHHLSWLSLLEYGRLSKQDTGKLPDDYQQLAQDVQFRIMLVQVGNRTTPEQLQELYLYYCHTKDAHICEGEEKSFLSSSAQDLLSSVLLEDPSLGACLLQALQAPPASPYSHFNIRLEALHIAALSGILQEIRKLAEAAAHQGNQRTHSETAISHCEDDAKTAEDLFGKTKQTLLDLLSLVHTDESLLDQLRLTPFFRDLCNTRVHFPLVNQLVPRHELYSALMGHPGEWLVRHFCDIEYEVHRREREVFLVVGGVTQTQKTMISTSLLEDRSAAWRTIFQLCQGRKQHFIDLIMDTSLTLIQRDQLECLGRLLSPAEFAPLRPLVVLMGWEHCTSMDIAQRLLVTLDVTKSENETPLGAACRELSYHVDLVQWCLEKTRVVLDEAGADSSQTRGSLLFQGLGTQSVLHMLHHGDRLALLDEQEVFALLRKRPQPVTQGASVVKWVRFEGEAEESAPVEQERDVAIYRGYCILQSLMAALEFAADKSNWELYSVINQKSSAAVSMETCLAGYLGRERSSSFEVSETQQWQSEMAAFQEVYNQHVMEPLKRAQQHLALLHPLTYRVEVLEDAFSLLFVTNEHVHDAFPSDSGDEGMDETRYLSVGNSPDIMHKGPATPESPVISDPFFKTAHSQRKPHIRALHLEFQDSDHRSDPQATFVTGNSIFSISKADLKYGSSSEGAKKLSGNNSNPSYDSTASAFNVGFLANEFFVRDILATLKSCLQDLVSARFTMMGTHGGRRGPSDSSMEEAAQCLVSIEMEEALMQSLHSSVEVSALQQRISSLRQCVNEATWRFELVAPDWLPIEVGSVVLDLQKLQEAHSKSESFDSVPGYGTNPRRPRRGKGIALQISVDSALSNGDSESHVSAATDCSTSGRSRSRRSRRRSSQETESPSRADLAQSCKGVIPRMLATKDSLLNMCLLKGAYNKAEQVIKIFNLEGQSGAAEVAFAEQYAQSVKALQKESRVKSAGLGKTSRPGAKLGAKLSVLKSSVASAAAAGMHSVSSTSTVDQVLGLITMSGFADSLFRIPTDISSPLKAHICPSHLPAMVVFDLACVGSRSWETSLNLVEMAMGRLQQASNQEVPVSVGDKKLGSSAIGFRQFLAEMEQLVKLGCLPEAGKDNLQMYYKRSLYNMLTTGTLPLWSATLKEYVKIINELGRDVKRVETAVTEMKKSRLMSSRVLSAENLSGSRSNSVERPESPAEAKLKVQEKPLVRNAMKWLLMTVSGVLPKMGLTSKLLGGSRNQTLHYLKSLYEHVKALSSLVEHCRGNKNLTYVEYFHMLEESPTEILGKLVFLGQMAPARLECMASKLHVDLTQIIVNGCCPSIPAVRIKDDEPNLSSAMVVNGRLVMNHGSPSPSEVKHPTLVVKEILTRFVDIMKEVTPKDDVFTFANLCNLVAEGRHWEVLPLTQEIKALDLALLETREEKLSFYGNLANLMTLHAMIHVVEEVMAQQPARSSASRGGPVVEDNEELDPSLVLPSSDFDLLVLHNKLAYHVGQLGVVSLYDMYHFVLRASCPLTQRQVGLEQARFHGIDNLDPWYEFGPPAEGRLLFVLADGSRSAPPLQVLSEDNVVSQLQVAEELYLDAAVMVDMDRKQVTLPELLLCHSFDFASEIEGGRPHEGLLNYVAGHTKGALNLDIQGLLDLYQQSGDKNPVIIQKRSHSRSFGYTLQFDTFKTFHHGTPGNPGENGEVIRNRTLTRTISQMPQTSRPESALFRLTPLTLNYLKEKDTLVAFLASCVSDIHRPPDNIVEEQLQDDICDNEDCDIVIKDRGERLKESYPVLARHISKQTLPLQTAKNPSLMKAGNPVHSLMCMDLEESIRISILSSPQNANYISAVQASLHDLIARQQWDLALQILHRIPFLALQNNLELNICRDFLLCCAACPPEENELPDDDYRWRYLLEVNDPSMKARAVLGNVTVWDIEPVLELLASCLASSIPCPLLREAVERRLQEMKVYEKIIDCAQTLKTKLSMQPTPRAPDDTGIAIATGVTSAMLEQLESWQQVVQVSSMNPGLVMDVLLECHDYTIARRWAAIYKLDPGLLEAIEGSAICYLLEKDQPDYIGAFQALELQLKADKLGCLKLCDGLLEKLHNKNNSLFVLHFMLEHLESELSPSRLKDLQLLSHGCQALLCLPESAWSCYDHLVEQPALLLEQLLMNMQVEWLGQVINCLHPELAAQPDTGMAFTINTIDDLLRKYAIKALEFPIPLNAEGNESTLTRSQSRLSLVSVQLSMNDYSNLSQISPVPRQDPRLLQSRGNTSPVTARKGPGKMPRSASAATLQGVYRPSGNTGRKISLGNEPPMASRLGASPGSSKYLLATSPGQPATLSAAIPQRHTMPPEPPQRSEWIPDSQVKVCMVCQRERFSMFVRRHHCRRCGWVVCDDCSKRTTIIGGVSARTCDLCYQQIFKPKIQEEQAHQLMVDQRFSGASPVNSPAFGVSPLLEEEAMRSPDLGHRMRIEYMLALDEDTNDSIREEFYFEQAPSPSLCLSILDLHSDERSCGKIILTLCDDVSKVLKPIGPGQRNPEVDYGLVISILKHLLFNAKMKFLTAGDSSGVEECDVHLSRVDLLSLLAAADCAYLPSIQLLGREDVLRRLRDYLIEEERLDLAMEVSTKCGIDPMGVWVAMGKRCLVVGDYEAAREKFQYSLRVPVDRNIASGSKLLENIVEFLENTAPPLGSQAESILQPLRSSQDLLSEPRMNLIRHYKPGHKPQEESSGHDLQLKECLYYLEKYGSHAARVNFYQRHGFFTKAVHFVLDKRCSVETFLESLLVPALQTGQFSRLQEQMLSVDKTLERWAAYLNAACKYLIKVQWLQALYQLQLFMKDYFRAAMTCIKHFYQAGAHSYAVLFQRVKHLHDAKQHLESYLEQQQWGAVNIHASRSAHAGPEHSFRMIRSPTEVNKYINTISLQIEVTKFLNMYIDNLEAVLSSTKMLCSPSSPTSPTSPRSPSSPELPSLFGSTRKKKDVVHLVLVSGNNVNDGFGLAFRIIQDFKLDYTSIYIEAGQHFAMHRKFSAIRQLLSCIKDSGLCTDQAYDEVILSSVGMLQDSAEAKEVEALIKMVRVEANMISAYIVCGKLRSAYLIAVKADRIEDVKRISGLAQKTGQTATKSICDKWLQQKGAL